MTTDPIDPTDSTYPIDLNNPNYRLLEEGEVVCDGDEVWHPRYLEWRESIFEVGKKCSRPPYYSKPWVRRRIVPVIKPLPNPPH